MWLNLSSIYTLPSAKKVNYFYDSFLDVLLLSTFLSSDIDSSEDIFKELEDKQTRYTYDTVENITGIQEKNSSGTYVDKSSYEYDKLGQLTRENSVEENKTRVYNYDNGGNITSIKEYAYTTGTLGSVTKTIPYAYTDTNWKDKLTSYDGQAISYDEIGNPTSYRGYTMGWSNGRELTSLSGNGLTASYTYDASGLRLSKTVNGVKTEYQYQDGKLLYEKKGEMELHYGYDSEGQPRFIQYVKADGSTGLAYLVTNSRGDVVGMCNGNGVMIVNYTYDAWGNILSVTDQNGTAITSAGNIGNLNSLRYRGYYYDTDTKMYYLQSRYYDSEVRRFINADDVSILAEDQGSIVENNLFVYCLNNPVNMADDEGDFAIAIGCSVGYLGYLAFSGAVSIALVGGVYDIYNRNRMRSKYRGATKKKLKRRQNYYLQPRTLPDVKAKEPQRNKGVYKMACINKNGNLVKMGKNMTFLQAKRILSLEGTVNKMTRKYGNKWGVYTYSQKYAKALAVAFDCRKAPEVHGSGYYGHYHDGWHKYHIWYSKPVYY